MNSTATHAEAAWSRFRKPLQVLTMRCSASLTGGAASLATYALAGSVVAVLVSIAASQLLLACAIAAGAWAARRACRPLRPWPPFVWPLVCFMAWTMAAAVASHDVPRGLTESRKFFLYAILFLTPRLMRSGNEILRTYRAIFVGSSISSAAGLVQFALNPSLDLLHRVSGFMSHWMTYSALLMLVLVALSAYAVCRRGPTRWWVFLLGSALVSGMYLSQTRNSWIGSVAGLTTVFVLKRRRALFPLIAVLLALFLISPIGMKHRLESGWDLKDPETRMRLELFATSSRMIRDNPWLGVGPKNVNVEALRYRGGGGEFPDWLYQHMHNNFLQIAAERGIPGLILWLWLMVRLGYDALSAFRAAGRQELAKAGSAEAALTVSTGALGAWVALLVAGMFEYNFGDSEVVTLFLFLMAAPYAFMWAGSARPRPE